MWDFSEYGNSNRLRISLTVAKNGCISPSENWLYTTQGKRIFVPLPYI